jgi:YVTN family beta-propeller protein
VNSPCFQIDSDELGPGCCGFLKRALPLLAVHGIALTTLGLQSVRAQNVSATVALESPPAAIVANPLTDKVYVSNGGNVTVIDGATNATTTIAGTGVVAVNPVTNMYYGSNGPFSGVIAPLYVTVIDGATNATATIAPGSAGPIAVNSVTNMIYVSNLDSVTVINGATNATTIIAAGSNLGPIAVNPVTNMIYVAVEENNSVTVIDGATNATTSVPVESTGPIAVDTTTNKIYVSNAGGDSVTVIDGATNATTSVTVGPYPGAIAVNPVTNKVYVDVEGSSSVTVIDEATNETTSVAVGTEPGAIAVNPVTNEIYVPNYNSGSVTVIDGFTNATTTVAVGSNPDAIALNAVTNRIYVANDSSNSVTVIEGAPGTPGAPSARLTNISTRAQVGTGGNALIPGFVIGGSGTETLLIRGDGPSLAQFDVPGVLAQPVLSLFDAAGTLIASNTGWGTNSDPAQIASIAGQVGAFPFAPGSADCALEVSLPAGAYTVEISGANNTSGVALAEIYEISSSGTRLVNISSRAQVGSGANMVISGFVISGTGTEELLVRADGPALSQFGVTGVLAQPSLSLSGGISDIIGYYAGWATAADPGLIAAFAAAVGAFPLPSGSSGITSSDSAQFVKLPPGSYTMQVSGVGNSTGVALAEVYEVPE